MRFVLRLNKKISLNNDTRNPIKLAKMAWDWAVHARGPLTVGAGQIGGATATSHSPDGRPDIQLLAMPVSLDKPGEPLHRFPGFTTVIWQCHPRSRGWLRIRSTDPKVQAEMQPNYLADEHDRKVMVEGMKIARDIHAQPAMKRLWDEEVFPGARVASDDEMLDCIRANACDRLPPGRHLPHGHRRRGGGEPGQRWRSTASRTSTSATPRSCPRSRRANTNAPSLMIGEKGAAHILAADWRLINL